jgi:hypothetical protein
MVRDITARGATLARLFSYTPKATEPALVIANRIYGTVDIEARTAEIVSRNKVRHPGFCAGRNRAGAAHPCRRDGGRPMQDEGRRDKIELKVAGRVHGGWTEAEVTVGIVSLAGSFDLSLSDSWPADGNQGSDIETRVIEAGSEAGIFVGGEQLITGYIDQVEPSLTDIEHAIRIAGRSKAADLLDCSAVHKPGSWSNRRFEDIAADLARPFGIDVTADVATGDPFKNFALQPG